MYIEESNEAGELVIWADGGRCGVCFILAGHDPRETEVAGDLATAIAGARTILSKGIRRRWPEDLIDLMRHAIGRAEAVA